MTNSMIEGVTPQMEMNLIGYQAIHAPGSSLDQIIANMQLQGDADIDEELYALWMIHHHSSSFHHYPSVHHYYVHHYVSMYGHVHGYCCSHLPIDHNHPAWHHYVITHSPSVVIHHAKEGLLQ